MITDVKEPETTELYKDLHFNQRLWINKIKFYKNQINILQSDLDKIVEHYFDKELMGEVEQYQNKFIVYTDLANRLIKEYKLLRNKIAKINGNGSIEIQEEISDKRISLKKKTAGFVDYVEDLKENFFIFYTSYYLSENHAYDN